MSTPRQEPPIDAVLLDVGGVLLIPDHDCYRPVLSAAGLDPGEDTFVRGHYAGMVAMDQLEELDWHAYFIALADTCGAAPEGLSALAGALEATWETAGQWRRILPGARSGLTRLAASGARLAMVSNSDGRAEESLRATRVCQVGEGPGVRVTAVIDSHVVGVEKPDPRIFDLALELVDVAPGHAVHVGDTVRYDVRGAEGAGVRGLHLDPFDLCPGREDHRHVRSLAEVAELVAAASPVAAPGG